MQMFVDRSSWKVKMLYVLSACTAYVDKTRRHETADLWHARLAHVSYNRLAVMMKKEMGRKGIAWD